MSSFTNTQLFFLSFASVSQWSRWYTWLTFGSSLQIWCENERKESMRNTIKYGSHSPSRFRVIGTVTNSVDFARAFQCPLGSPMNPRKKCLLWWPIMQTKHPTRIAFNRPMYSPLAIKCQSIVLWWINKKSHGSFLALILSRIDLSCSNCLRSALWRKACLSTNESLLLVCSVSSSTSPSDSLNFCQSSFDLFRVLSFCLFPNRDTRLLSPPVFFGWTMGLDWRGSFLGRGSATGSPFTLGSSTTSSNIDDDVGTEVLDVSLLFSSDLTIVETVVAGLGLVSGWSSLNIAQRSSALFFSSSWLNSFGLSSSCSVFIFFDGLSSKSSSSSPSPDSSETAEEIQ